MIQEIIEQNTSEQFDGIVIEHAILHHLDPENKGMGGLLVDYEIDFSYASGPEVKLVLERFVQRAYDGCLNTAESIAMIDPDDDSTTLGICWKTLDTPDYFIKASRTLHKRLNHAMTTRFNIAEGDMFLVVARDALGPMIGVLKLEKWEELVRTYEHQADGTIKPIVVPNSDVIHTRTVPQKCAFIRPPDHKYGPYVRLNDNQARDHDTAARFFVEHFLGCRLIATRARRTINFCVAAESWRQEHALYLPKQGLISFASALESHLNRPTLSFEEFARQALANSNVDEVVFNNLVEFLSSTVYPPESKGAKPKVPPDTFSPDPETVENLLKKIDLTLSNGIQISGKYDNMIDTLESLIVDKEEGVRKLTIPLHTTSIMRRFPGASIARPQVLDEFQEDKAE